MTPASPHVRQTCRNNPSKSFGFELPPAGNAVASSLVLVLLLIVCFSVPAFGQAADGIRAGEGFLTRFSGTTQAGGETVIDMNGTVGSVVDLRNPGQPPQGLHWLNEPQRLGVTAGQVGQVFGVALDDAATPSVYLTATSAFGLHLDQSGSWMSGLWGPGGGPGTVWKLDAANNYKPVIFAQIGTNGRLNTGAALGNIAYDRWNKQFYVSDLETGFIHRLALDGGADLEQYDHGQAGRVSFFDAITGVQGTLPSVAFDPASSANPGSCPSGNFAKSPECWNFADFRRRVWGLGVRQDKASGNVRLYYAVWSSQGFANPDFGAAAAEEKLNTVWSVAIGSDGSFDTSDIRKELVLPDFFTDPADVSRMGHSHPVTDIAFCKCDDKKVMILSERGGVRNLGLDQLHPFARPNEARVLRYRFDDTGTWQIQGRYDVGFYDRKNQKRPWLRANSSGGVDFGYGYGLEWAIDSAKQDKWLWMTGHVLCSPDGPCYNPDIGAREDGSHVHGAQGTPEDAFEDLLPSAAAQPYPTTSEPYPPKGPQQSYMIDADINVGPSGNVDMASLNRDDATKIGDIEIHEPCAPVDAPPPVEEQPPGIEQPPVIEEPPFAPDEPDLEKVKTGPAQCTAGGLCTFDITISNLGPGTWRGPLWETDTLPPGATLWDYGPQPDWMCTQVGGTTTVNCTHSWVTLLPGDSVNLSITVLLPFGVTGLIQNCIQNDWLPTRDPNDPAVILAIERALNALGYPVGPIDGVLDAVTMNGITQFQNDNGLPPNGLPDAVLVDLLFGGNAAQPGDADPANDGDCHTVNVLPAAPPVAPQTTDLQIRKIQTTGLCVPGGLCNFELWFVNRGAANWSGRPSITDTLPPGASFVANTGAWACNQAGQTVTCDYPFQVTLLPNGMRRVTLTVRLPQNPPRGAQNCGTVGPSINLANDPNPVNNTQCIPMRVAPLNRADLWIFKRQVSPPCMPGQVCTFDLWVGNRGPSNWNGRVRITDTLPPGAKLQNSSPGWQCSQAGRQIECEHPQRRLRPGWGLPLRLTVQLPQGMPRGQRNCATIGWFMQPGVPPRVKNDPVPQNNNQCIVIASRSAPPPKKTEKPKPPVSQPEITVEKVQASQCKSGDSCTFRIKFINQGPGTWDGRPKISDLLPVDGVKLGSWSPAGWDCLEHKGAIACDHPRTKIAPGQPLTLDLTLQLPDGMKNGSKNCVILDPALAGGKRTQPPIHCTPVVIIAPPVHTPKPPSLVTPRPTHVCPPGTYSKKGKCVRPSAECPEGTVRRGRKCVRIREACPAGSHKWGRKCIKCPRGTTFRKGRCYRRGCPRGTYKWGRKCIKCPKGARFRKGKCYYKKKKRVHCPPGTIRRGRKCIRKRIHCPPGTIPAGNICIRIRIPTPGHGHGGGGYHYD